MAMPEFSPSTSPDYSADELPNRTRHLASLAVDRPVIWIRSYAEAERFNFNEKAALCGRVHFDTETGGIKALEEALNARPALAQFNLPEVRNEAGRIIQRAQVVIFDLKRLEEDAKLYFRREGKRRNPFEPFAAALEDPTIIKIIQQSTFERELCKRYGVGINNIRDTKTVAKSLRPDLAHCLTLQALCAEICGVWMDKGPQTSDWLKRPLAKEERTYAALDVIALEVLDDTLTKMERKRTIAPSLSLEALLVDLHATYRERVAVGRDVVGRWHEYCFEQQLLKQKAQGLAASEMSLLERHGLIDASIHWQGVYGSTTAWRTARREFDFERFRKLHPEAASSLLGKEVSQSALRSFLAAELPSPEFSARERGFIFRRLLRQQYAPAKASIDADLESLYGASAADAVERDRQFLGEHSLFSEDTLSEIRALARELRPDLATTSMASLCREIIGIKLRPLTSSNPFKVMRDEAFNSEAVSQLRRYLRESIIKISGRVRYLTPEDPEVITRRMVELEGEKRALWGHGEVGNLYWPLVAREEALREAIKEKLLEKLDKIPPNVERRSLTGRGRKDSSIIPEGAEEVVVKPISLEERYGAMSASIERRVHRSVDIDALIALFPADAPALIRDHAPDGHSLHEYFASKGIQGADQRPLFDEFMRLLGWSAEPSASASAKYKLLYADAPEEGKAL